MGITRLQPGDALVVVDAQVDFVSGSLAVPGAARVLPALRHCIAAFAALGLPVFATRDWHPPDHVSFAAQGGPWPPHCVAGTPGAELAEGLGIGGETEVVSKGTHPGREAYSAFEGTDLDARLRRAGAKRLFVGGLATDYCVLHTVRDAIGLGYAVVLLLDAMRAVDATPHAGDAAIREMLALGAQAARSGQLGREAAHG